MITGALAIVPSHALDYGCQRGAAGYVCQTELAAMRLAFKVSGNDIHGFAQFLTAVWARHVEHSCHTARRYAHLARRPGDHHGQDGHRSTTLAHHGIQHALLTSAHATEDHVIKKLVPLVGLVVGIAHIRQLSLPCNAVEGKPLLAYRAYVFVFLNGGSSHRFISAYY